MSQKEHLLKVPATGRFHSHCLVRDKAKLSGWTSLVRLMFCPGFCYFQFVRNIGLHGHCRERGLIKDITQLLQHTASQDKKDPKSPLLYFCQERSHRTRYLQGISDDDENVLAHAHSSALVGYLFSAVFGRKGNKKRGGGVAFFGLTFWTGESSSWILIGSTLTPFSASLCAWVSKQNSDCENIRQTTVNFL